MSGLLELAERVEAAVGPDRELNLAIAKAVGRERWYAGGSPKWHFTASLDAALTLVPEGCLCVRFGWNMNPKAKLLGGAVAAILEPDFAADIAKAAAATPALALCAAALRARAAGESA